MSSAFICQYQTVGRRWQRPQYSLHARPLLLSDRTITTINGRAHTSIVQSHSLEMLPSSKLVALLTLLQTALAHVCSWRDGLRNSRLQCSLASLPHARCISISPRSESPRSCISRSTRTGSDPPFLQGSRNSNLQKDVGVSPRIHIETSCAIFRGGASVIGFELESDLRCILPVVVHIEIWPSIGHCGIFWQSICRTTCSRALAV